MKNCLKIQLRRALAPKLLFIVLLIVIVEIMGNSIDIRNGAFGMVVNGTGMGYLTALILPAVVFSDSLASEWENQAVKYWVIRSGIRKYALSKMTAAGAAGFACLFLAFGIMILIGGLFGPWYTAGLGGSVPYAKLLEQGQIFQGYLMILLDKGLSGAVTAVLGMAASTYITNSFCAVSAPLVIVLTASRLAEFFHIPYAWEPVSFFLSLHPQEPVPAPVVTLLIKAGISLMLLLILTVIAVHQMERRIEDV